MVKPRILTTSILAETHLFSIEALDINFPNGNRATFETIRNKSDGVVMVAMIDESDNLLMIREYAAGIDAYELGFVKGKIDPGESPDIAANREMKEEVGYGANILMPLRTVTMSPAYNNLKTHLYIATNLYPESAQGDEIEPLEQIRWPRKNIQQLLAHPEVNDARVLLLLNTLINNQL